MKDGLKRVVRPAFRAALFSLGCHAARLTKTADIVRLLEKLRPQDCGIELVRIGGNQDGGYLIPNDLEGIEYCFSPGVGQLSLFEEQLADRHIKCFMADYSVTGPAVDRPDFTFDKKFLGAYDHDEYITLASWKERYLKDYAGDMLLQMDIEGGEYEAILSTPESLLSQFRIIAIEFHELDKLLDSFTFKLFASCFEKLLKHFTVVHIHPNNTMEVVKFGGLEIPRTMEFTFLNNRRIRGRTTPCKKFPHSLDVDAELYEKHLILPRCWY